MIISTWYVGYVIQKGTITQNFGVSNFKTFSEKSVYVKDYNEVFYWDINRNNTVFSIVPQKSSTNSCF